MNPPPATSTSGIRNLKQFEDGGGGGGGGVEDSSCGDEHDIQWTDEKHFDFIHAMEATFIRTVLVQSNGYSRRRRHNHQQHQIQAQLMTSFRLDRYVPDISQSTLDLIIRRTKTTASTSASTSTSASASASASTGIAHQRRRPSSVTTAPNSDQVVPELQASLQ